MDQDIHTVAQRRDRSAVSAAGIGATRKGFAEKLAEEVTCFVHSRADYEFAVKASEILFGNATTEIVQELTEEQLLQVMEGVPSIDIERAALADGYEIVGFLADTQIFRAKAKQKKCGRPADWD
jgi:tyrosyl-tRNA synthetase